MKMPQEMKRNPKIKTTSKIKITSHKKTYFNFALALRGHSLRATFSTGINSPYYFLSFI